VLAGIVLWELMLRKLPYEHLRTSWAIRDAVVAGERPPLPPPPHAFPPAYTELMRACWAQDAAARPPMAAAVDQLRAITAGPDAGVPA
jgi:hypothetical protein